VAMMIANLLTRAKCKVAVALTAERGMQLAEAGNFDLITLDIQLPDANGVSVCRRLKANPRLCDTPVVLVSGPCGQDMQRGFEAGATGYIAKPFKALDFASHLLSHLNPINAVTT
jgi:CheY-like chemotaxis protein